MLEGKLDQNNFVYPTWNLEVSKEETSKSISAQTFFCHGGYLPILLVAVWVNVVIASLIYLVGLWRPKSEAAGFETTVTAGKATMARPLQGHR